MKHFGRRTGCSPENHSDSGRLFTLIELLIVVAIITTL